MLCWAQVVCIYICNRTKDLLVAFQFQFVSRECGPVGSRKKEMGEAWWMKSSTELSLKIVGGVFVLS
jgi:hypothetical protein